MRELLRAGEEEDRPSFLAHPVGPDLREVDAELGVSIGLDDVRRASVGLERAQGVAVGILADVDQRPVLSCQETT